METKDNLTEIEAKNLIAELDQSDTTVDASVNENGTYCVSWVTNKTYVAVDGKEFTDEVWTTIDGKMIHVQDLEPEHAKNIIRMMLRNKRALNHAIAELLNRYSDEISNIGEEALAARVLH